MAAVAKLSELVQYRETIKDCGMDILLLGYSEVEEIRLLMENGLLNEERVIFSIYNLRQFHDLDKLGRALNKRFRVHIRLDDWNTGMGLGYEEFLNAENELFAAEGVCICGLYDHLISSYSENHEEIHRELEQFSQMIKQIRPEHRSVLTVHVLNSPLIFLFPEYAFDMVRVGSAMYGLPCSDSGRLRPILRISARVFDVRTIDASTPLSYRPQESQGKRKVARVMLGSWDCPILLTLPDVQILIRGRLYPLAGEPCMDSICIDISGSEDIVPGDEAVILGERGVTLEKIMKRHYVPYGEHLCFTAGRLEKVYV